MNCGGGARILNYGRLRYKESDRVASILDMARRFGARVDVSDGCISIRRGGEKPGRVACDSRDHRIIMAYTVAAMALSCDLEIREPGHVAKSYPSFFGDLRALLGNGLRTIL
ncbi:hypothetical protein [Thermogymnomonas acidicola]|uniref:hypothetical protein n=1 Tax=Thermogymnomonas acidicola TaxID=399579 RepID=UPI001396BC2F|nr:hypothetical protein [Thermogymnomonas acidicola]